MSCCLLISREKTATASLQSSAMCSAMFIISAVLPIEGLAAITIMSVFWRPSVILSNWWNPVATPPISPLLSYIFSIQ